MPRIIRANPAQPEAAHEIAEAALIPTPQRRLTDDEIVALARPIIREHQALYDDDLPECVP